MVQINMIFFLTTTKHNVKISRPGTYTAAANQNTNMIAMTAKDWVT